MDLSAEDVETALTSVAAAWRRKHPNADEARMPAVLQAAEAGKERTMKCSWCMTEKAGSVCGSCGLDATKAQQATESLSASLRKDLAHEGMFTGTATIPSGLTHAQWDTAWGALRATLAKKEATVSTVKDRDQVWSEIEAAAATSPGDSKAEKIRTFLKANPQRYSEYQSAPQPKPEAPKPPPAPMTLTEAERRFSEKAPGSAWELIEARAHALAAKDAMTFAAAVRHIVETDRALANAYVAQRV